MAPSSYFNKTTCTLEPCSAYNDNTSMHVAVYYRVLPTEISLLLPFTTLDVKRETCDTEPRSFFVSAPVDIAVDQYLAALSVKMFPMAGLGGSATSMDGMATLSDTVASIFAAHYSGLQTRTNGKFIEIVEAPEPLHIYSSCGGCLCVQPEELLIGLWGEDLGKITDHSKRTTSRCAIQ